MPACYLVIFSVIALAASILSTADSLEVEYFDNLNTDTPTGRKINFDKIGCRIEVSIQRPNSLLPDSFKYSADVYINDLLHYNGYRGIEISKKTDQDKNDPKDSLWGWRSHVLYLSVERQHSFFAQVNGRKRYVQDAKGRSHRRSYMSVLVLSGAPFILDTGHLEHPDAPFKEFCEKGPSKDSVTRDW